MRTMLLALVTLSAACGSDSANSTDTLAISGADTGHVSSWLPDPDEGQLPDSQLAFFPPCAGTTLVTPDSLGPVRPGMTLWELTARCPRQFRYWHWEEGIPQPAIAIRVSGALLKVLVGDTASSSIIEAVRSADSSARTATGVGPGTSLDSLERAFGPLKFQTAECAVYAYSPRQKGLSWLLVHPTGLDCDDLGDVEEGKRRVSGATRVHSAIVHRRRVPVTCATRPVPIGPDSIGVLQRGATIADLRKLCAAADTALSTFGNQYAALAFRFGNVLVLAYQRTDSLDDAAPPDAWKVRGCNGVLYQKVATCATWTEVIGAFGMAGSGNTEFGPAVISLESLPSVSLEFDVTGTQVGSLEAQPDLSSMPGRARLVEITLAATPRGSQSTGPNSLRSP